MRSFVSVGFASVLVGALGTVACGGDDASVGPEPDAATDGSTAHDASADTSSHLDTGTDAPVLNDARSGDDDASDGTAPLDAGNDAGSLDASDGATGDDGGSSDASDASDASTGDDASDASTGDDASDGAAADDGSTDGGAGDDGSADASDGGLQCGAAANGEITCPDVTLSSYDPVAKMFTFHLVSPIPAAAMNLSVEYTDEFGYSKGNAFGACLVNGNTITCDFASMITHEVLEFTLIKLYIMDDCNKESDFILHIRTPKAPDGGASTDPWPGSCN